MKNNKKLNNKGFSLVELIIVVAIMAVLVGVLAPQYMRYIDRSKSGMDQQFADGLRQAISTSLLDPALKGAPTLPTSSPVTKELNDTNSKDTGSNNFWKNVYMIMGCSDAAGVESQLKLDNNQTNVKIEYTIDKNAKVSVKISGGKYNDYPVEAK